MVNSWGLNADHQKVRPLVENEKKNVLYIISRLADLGLEQFDTAGLFIKLLSPTSFLIIIIMQVHYFHTPFLKLSAFDRFR